MNYKIYRDDNYIVVINTLTQETQYGFVKEVFIDKSNTNNPSYRIFNVRDFDDKKILIIGQITKENDTLYTQTEFEAFYTQNTGNFNSGGSSDGVQSVTGASVDNTDPSNPIINSIEEAPNDGNQYARQNEAWSIVSGNSQNLQQTMDSGRQWVNFSDPDNITYFSAGSPSIEDDVFAWQGKTNSFAIASDRFNILSGKQVDDAESPTVPRIQLLGEIPLSNGVLTFKLPNNKPFNGIGGTYSGEYILTTSDDINLQEIVNNIAIASLDGGSSEVRLLSGSVNNRIISLRTENDDSGSSLDLNNSQINLSNSTVNGDLGQFGVDQGWVEFKQSKYISGEITRVSFETPIALGSGAEIKIPAKLEGEYTFALREDLSDSILTSNLTEEIKTNARVMYYTYTGETAAIWTMPTLVGNTKQRLVFYNTSTAGIVTINTNTGGNDIYDSGTLVNTMLLNPGERIEFFNNGQYYIMA